MNYENQESKKLIINEQSKQQLHKTIHMKFTVEIGENEKQVILFSFNKFWGNLKISVNGKAIIRDIRLFSINLVKPYEFKVGEKEIHNIRIEKIRPLVLAGFRSNDYKIYVDGEFYKVFRD